MLSSQKMMSAPSGEATYVDDVFSTYLYTGNGTTQTITNGIDLAGEGGLVWIKSRSTYNTSHFLFDTARGSLKEINTNNAQAEATLANSLTAFNSNGFSIGSAAGIGVNADTYASWTFRKQPKFFDVVTYTGNDTAGRTVSHNLGSVPGCIIVKRTSASNTDWYVYHRSLGATKNLRLNTTDPEQTTSSFWNDTEPTSTVFTVGSAIGTNGNGSTFVAYLFAHDAGGFGEASTDNAISCGSFTSNSSGQATVSLGYEPQWVLWKPTTEGNNWFLLDNMRGWNLASSDFILEPNTINSEGVSSTGNPTATGFFVDGVPANTPYIYIAIRRPHKPPTTGTEVFNPQYYSGNDVYPRDLTTNFPVDMTMFKDRLNTTGYSYNSLFDKLRGSSAARLLTGDPEAESAGRDGAFSIQSNTAIRLLGENINYATTNYANYNFKRAPGFFDVVCYTGTGSAATQTHNLTAAPELMLVKRRDLGADWAVYSSALANTEYLVFNRINAKATGTTRWNSTSPTSTVFSIGTDATVNASGATYVAYLFATLPGISKIGSYTGTGTTNSINCGFTGGARLVMIKRTDSTADWYVWDTARGIVSGNDAYYRWNTNSGEFSSLTGETDVDYIDPLSSGFQLSSTAPAEINASGGTFIFLAIA
jgi:hypothetical protein